MNKLIVQNEKYFFGLIALIGLILLYNVFATIVSMQVIGLLPITIQSILLFLLLSKNQYSKIAAKIWAAVFLIGAASLKIFGTGLMALGKSIKEGSGMDLITSHEMISSIILLIIGIIAFILIREMGTVGLIDEEKS